MIAFLRTFLSCTNLEIGRSNMYSYVLMIVDVKPITQIPKTSRIYSKCILDHHHVWRSHDPTSVQTFDFCDRFSYEVALGFLLYVCSILLVPMCIDFFSYYFGILPAMTQVCNCQRVCMAKMIFFYQQYQVIKI